MANNQNQNSEQQNQQELMVKFRVFEQRIQNLNQQLEAVEQAINEMGSISLGLDEIKGAEGKEILSPLGRGVFVKTKLSSEDLIVDIGDKNFVKKSIPDTKDIISIQIKKLEEVRGSLNAELESIESELAESIREIQGLR